MNEILSGILDAVQGVDPALRTVLAGIAIMLETSVLIGLVVPGDTIVIVAATAVSSPWEGVILAIVVVVGALAGETVGFFLGRFLGPWIRRSRLGRWIGEDKWARSERYLQRRGGPAIFLSRFLPVLHSLVPLTVGMSGFIPSLPRLDGARVHPVGGPVRQRGVSGGGDVPGAGRSTALRGVPVRRCHRRVPRADLRREEDHRTRRAPALQTIRFRSRRVRSTP